MIYKLISPTESQVGKYIDTNGDGIPEGIIFIDLSMIIRCIKYQL